MPRSVKLGDTRILEKKNPGLSSMLERNINLDDDRFRSPEFSNAMADTRRGYFDTLENFLNPDGLSITDYYANPGALVEVADGDSQFNGDFIVRIPENVERGKPLGINKYPPVFHAKMRLPEQNSWNKGAGPVVTYAFFEPTDAKGYLDALPLSKVRLIEGGGL